MTNLIYFNQIDKIIDVNKICEIIPIQHSDIAFISGSLVEGCINKSSKGMGNRLSDIDVFILKNKDSLSLVNTSDDLDYDYDGMKVSFTGLYGISVDIEIYSLESIADMICQLNEINFDDASTDKRLKNWIKSKNGILLNNFLSFLHRLNYSIPIHNKNKYEQFKNSIKYDNYYKYMSIYHINCIDVRYEDVIGNLDSGQYIVAVEGSREILKDSISAYMFFKNQSIDREKWIPLRMRNLSLEDSLSEKIYNRYIKLMYGSNLNSDGDYKINAEEIIDFSNYIVRKIN